ncbi:hypothetical protein AVEN_221274-1 [Araneus ventricosus]|uniref:Uncharacterized protein n=1 Tax=Araneus ventricosus TaxID=182803 RepID=A0A4Y2B120_ARAVE|nr:hypothetical protein AVEN_221274-1 [Araneus ventricosus]
MESWFGLESLWAVVLASMCSMEEFSLLRDTEAKSSSSMSDYTLVLLIRNSFRRMIMLDLSELGLSKNILRMKVWSKWTGLLYLRALIRYIIFGTTGGATTGKVTAANTLTRSLNKHEQQLFHECSLFHISVSENSIESMKRRCLQCITVSRGHIPS